MQDKIKRKHLTQQTWEMLAKLRGWHSIPACSRANGHRDCSLLLVLTRYRELEVDSLHKLLCEGGYCFVPQYSVHTEVTQEIGKCNTKENAET